MIDIIKKYGSKTNTATDINKEPVLKDLFPPKASYGGNVPIRGDILLDIGGVKKVLDIVISNPRAHSESRLADTPSIAAYIAALKKENLYTKTSSFRQGTWFLFLGRLAVALMPHSVISSRR